MAKDFFKENNVEFTEYDVASDQSKAEEMVKRSGQMGVPVIVVSKDDSEPEMLVGFQESRLKELLGIK